MGCNTCGRIRGYISHEDIFQFIKTNYDATAKCHIDKFIICPLSEVEFDFKLQPHSDDSENWYSIKGGIEFQYKGESRRLFYDYYNINCFEKIDYYNQHGLKDMVESETTYLSLGFWGSSVEIISELIKQFGGGWVDDNDCDDEPYHEVGFSHQAFMFTFRKDGHKDLEVLQDGAHIYFNNLLEHPYLVASYPTIAEAHAFIEGMRCIANYYGIEAGFSTKMLED